jgi:1,4-alpha-glucan branching enzyme
MDEKKIIKTAKRAESKEKAPAVQRLNVLTDEDVYLFNEGSHFDLYQKMGSRPMSVDGQEGAHFAVWAPDAERVAVIGDFNGWNAESHFLHPRADSGIWEGFIAGVEKGALYKYHVTSRYNGYSVDKYDPFAFCHETAPRTASIVCDLDYEWGDGEWMKGRGHKNSLDAPLSIYEVHLGSWARVPEEGNRSLTYREMAPRLADYLLETGFTHVEFLPVMEHPFYGSWGYQVTGFFAPTSRYGEPRDFMYLIDYLHRRGIGVILDWVPSHFPTDEHSLGYFDGTHLYEHADPRQGIHPDWNSYIFNYDRNEVVSFLVSSAMFWLDRYHADGLRVDAVASMLYLDYSRKQGEWIPNDYGGRENIGAINFLRRLNEGVYKRFPDVQTIAEESTAWPAVSRPVHLGGLGFGMKWDMGWMHDVLRYMSRDPVFRYHHHNELSFRMLYAFHENFILPLSHDEVVHGKGSLLAKMPGDDWQKFANMRLLLTYMFSQAGKKLLFMGAEIGQWSEWDHEQSLEWHLLQHQPHAGLKRLVGDLNAVYRRETALHEREYEWGGFEWIDANDASNSVLSFLRKGRSDDDVIVAVLNFTPVPRYGYRVGVPAGGFWKEIFNSDAEDYGGSGHGNFGGLEAAKVPFHGRPWSLELTLPPLAGVYLKSGGSE